jgi:hypothetical protein
MLIATIWDGDGNGRGRTSGWFDEGGLMWWVLEEWLGREVGKV